MTARQQRRHEERKARKAALKSEKSNEGNTTTTAAPEIPSSPTRAAINRANSQHSTGPRTAEGKSAASQNAFKHGLYSKQLILPGEDPIELDALRSDFRREHQPATTTEDILVNELAEHYWRLRRMRKLEARAMGADNFETGLAILPIIQRTMASAERGFHKALKTLTDLQRQRGFVPQIAAAPAPRPKAQSPEPAPPTGFVPQITPETHAATVGAPLSHPESHHKNAA